MNYSKCSLLDISLLPFIEDIFPQPKAVIAAAIILSAVALFTLSSNLIFIVIMLCTNRTRNDSRNKSNDNTITMMLMMSMAISDITCSISVMPLSIVEVIENGKWNLGETWCTARLTINNFLCSVSIFHVNCMALDMYMAVCKPLFYRLLTNRTGYIMVMVSWLVPSALVVLPRLIGLDKLGAKESVECVGDKCTSIYTQSIFFIVLTVVVPLPFLTSYVFYFFILREVSRFHKRKPKYSNKPSAGRHEDICEKSNSTDCSKDDTLASTISAKHTFLVDSPQAEHLESVASNGIALKSGIVSFDFNNDVQIANRSELTISTMLDTSVASRNMEDERETCSLGTSNDRNVKGFTEFDTTESNSSTHAFKRYTPSAPQKDENANLSLTRRVKTDTSTETAQGQDDTSTVAAQGQDDTSTVTAQGQDDTKLVTNQPALLTSETTVSSNQSMTSRSNMATKAYRTVGGLVFCFTVCWFPSWIFLSVYLQFESTIPQWAVFLITWLGYSNAAFNPILYLGNRSVRNGVKAFCGKRQ